MLLIGSPLLPFLFFFEHGRETVRDLVWSARGIPGPTTVVTIHPLHIGVERSRAGRVLSSWRIDIADLLCVSWAPGLGYDRDVERHPPRLTLRTPQTAQVLRIAREENGALVRAFLVAAVLQVRARQPGTPGLMADGTRCPYCATLYRLEPGARCPSCSAHATGLA